MLYKHSSEAKPTHSCMWGHFNFSYINSNSGVKCLELRITIQLCKVKACIEFCGMSQCPYIVLWCSGHFAIVYMNAQVVILLHKEYIATIHIYCVF